MGLNFFSIDGDWPEVEKLCCKPFIRNQRAFLYAIYRQQFLELIEHREIQEVSFDVYSVL